MNATDSNGAALSPERDSGDSTRVVNSRVIRAIEHGDDSYAVAREWLRAELSPFFARGETELTHEARIHILAREASESPARGA